MENKKQCSIKLTSVGSFTNTTDWPTQFLWFKDNLEKFSRYFKPILKNF